MTKKNLSLLLLLCLCALSSALSAQEAYRPTWRLELSYLQSAQRQAKTDNAKNVYFGGRIGGMVEFDLPRVDILKLRTGLSYSLQYADNTQHYALANSEGKLEYVDYQHYMHNVSVPLHVLLTVRIWKDLHLFAYGGPQFVIGLAHTTKADPHLTATTQATLQATLGHEVGNTTRDLYATDDFDGLRRLNVQAGVGGGIQWKRVRLFGGYDWGLNDIGRAPYRTRLSGWYAGTSYAF